MSSVNLPMVDVADIIRLVGQAAFGRAQDCARRGAVASLTWEADAGRLIGTVQGGSPHPYTCFVQLAQDAQGRFRPGRSLCGCPMERECKHVAALILSSNATRVRELAAGSERPAAAPEVHPEEQSTWRSALAGLLDPPAVQGVPAAPTPMALQFSPRDQPRRRYPRELSADGARPPASAGPLRRSERRLGVRPVLRSATGNWVKGSLTWSNLPYQLNRLNLDPGQHRWFSQFPPLHRAGPHVYRGGDGEWLDLDDFASPLLWHLLDEAARIGIQLVGTKRGVPVTVGQSAELTLDAIRGRDGEVRLSPVATIDGEPHALDTVGAVGGHGLYSIVGGDDPGGGGAGAPHSALRLAPTRGPLSGEQLALLSGPTDVVVPAREVDRFLSDAAPVLRRSIRMTSSDGSVVFPEIRPPVLVLTAKYRAKQTLRLEWHWEYPRGDTFERMPLQPSAGDPGRRDTAAERAIIDRVVEQMGPAGVADPGGSLPASTELSGIAAAEFTAGTLPRIERLDGVRVVIDGVKPDYRELTDTPKLTLTTVETDERDWFDLGVIVTVGDTRVPFGPLFTALVKGRKKLLLIDGSYLSLDRPVFDSLRELIEEARALDEWDTGLRISRYQTSLWSDLEDVADEAQPAEAWRDVVAGLAGAAGVGSTPVPERLAATLRPYQADGFDWLAFLWRHRLGGILADDMGLGKTLQTLALLAHVQEQTDPRARLPFLVVAPASVVPNWVGETKRFTPDLTVEGIAGTQAKSGIPVHESAGRADVVITSYALFRLDFDAYRQQQWAGLILDEAQFVKNRASAVHQCARDFPAPFKLAITGTPMENNLMELWSLFAIVAPGLFPSARRFAEEYQRPIERGSGVRPGAGIRSGPGTPARQPFAADDAAPAVPDEGRVASELLAKLRRRIRPLMLRRTKEQVATELPPKQEQVLAVELTPKHRALYDTHLQRERQKLLGLMEDLDRNRFTVFRSLTLLRLLSLDASLVDERHAGVGSAKLDALLEQLDDVIGEGHRALVFSQFTSFLAKVGDRLTERGIGFTSLDGSTRRRGEVVDRFKAGDASVFLISLKAGGFGLNLTEADYVFLLDPWWNPAAEEQAIDRTHRIGQGRNVMVYRMVSAGTIEEKVMALKERKARLFDSVLDDGAAFASALTADDLRVLLGE